MSCPAWSLCQNTRGFRRPALKRGLHAVGDAALPVHNFPWPEDYLAGLEMRLLDLRPVVGKLWLWDVAIGNPQDVLFCFQEGSVLVEVHDQVRPPARKGKSNKKVRLFGKSIPMASRFNCANASYTTNGERSASINCTISPNSREESALSVLTRPAVAADAASASTMRTAKPTARAPSTTDRGRNRPTVAYPAAPIHRPISVIP